MPDFNDPLFYGHRLASLRNNVADRRPESMLWNHCMVYREDLAALLKERDKFKEALTEISKRADASDAGCGAIANAALKDAP